MGYWDETARWYSERLVSGGPDHLVWARWRVCYLVFGLYLLTQAQ